MTGTLARETSTICEITPRGLAHLAAMEERDKELDPLVRSCTSCNSWPQLRRRLWKGFVPTLRGSRRERLLARILRARGYKVNAPAPRECVR
ncbi:hypothetical protein [Zavarzinella formosa]|uniref:hypothetical protein n=1 Tax=Zavarzinella formosa TaxID=360055 RepID=UPI0002D6B376|nr:hypothetical protein [Zavarzinella formosa]